jgi:hypothetical protein
MRKIIKKALRIVMWALLTCIVLLVALFFLVQNSSIQTFLAQKAASYLSRELETKVYIDKLKIVFPLDIDIKNFGIDDRRGAALLRTEKLQISLNSLSRRDHNINIGRVALENPEINLITYEGDSVMNFQFVINYFVSGEPDTTVSAPWSFNLHNASISNASFAMHNFNFDPKPEFLDFNHIQLQGLHIVLSELQYFNDTLNVQLHHLSANEHSGIVLNRLRADLSLTPGGIFTKDLVIQTPASDLLLDLAFLFNDFSAFTHFTDSVSIHADIYHSELDLTDLAGFVPELAGMDSKITFEGQLRGEVNSLRLKDFAINYGSYTSFRGNINMDGLPNIKETFIHLNAKELTTHYSDLQTLKLPSANGPTFLKLPEEVMQLGFVKIKGRFTGFYTDFVSDGTFITDLGVLTTDISLKYNFENRRIVYAGQIDTRQFNLGQFLDKEEILGFINMKATVDGHGQFPSTFNAKFTADITSFDFMKNNIDSLLVTGELLEKKFNGNLAIRDELLSLDFLGLFDLNHDPPVFNFTAVLSDAYLAQLNLIERDSSARLSAKVELDFTGSNLDNLQGHILINEASYYEKDGFISMDTFDLNALPVNAGKRALALRSDYIDADIEGSFNYSEIYPAFRNILRFYLPSFEEDETLADTEVPEQSFTYFITLKNTQDISQLFLPDVVVNTNAIIEGRFNSDENIVGVAARAGDITLYGTTLKDWTLAMNAASQNLYVRTGAGRLSVIESENGKTPEIGLDNLLIDANFAGDSIVYNIAWSDPEDPQANSGDLAGFFTFVNSPQLELQITESAFTINSIPWWFNNDNFIIFDTTAVQINQLVLQNDNEKIMMHGKISNDPVEKLAIAFEQWNLANLDVFLKNTDVDIKGLINGNIDLMELYENPNMLADLVIDDFHLNHERLGDLHLNTSWDPATKSVWVDSHITYTGNVGTIIPFRLQGFYYPRSETENLDLELQLLNFKLEIVEPFLEGILSDIRGLASGNVLIKGLLKSPDVNGSVSLMRTEFKVDFSNVYYSIADVITIEKDRIWADNVSIFDQHGNSGTANLLFTHKNFSDWRMDLRVQANNLAGLQTSASDNRMFYGDAYASGSFTMAGPFNDLKTDVRVRTGPETNIAIPISFAVDVAENDFIVFTNPDADTVDVVIEERAPSSFSLGMDIEITRDAEIQIFLPYQMGNIRSSGSGNMQMFYNTAGDFTMYGDYLTNEGTFLLTLQKMINRSFSLLPGGIIRWSGDPYNADINIQAVYRTRVTLNSLPNIDQEGRFPVDCIITLKNSLMNPEISFGIRLPNVDEEIQRQVFSAIDTTNEVVMNRQMISLLVLNSFNFSTDQTNLASTLESSSFELLSNQLNSWLSQISKDFDIGVNYRPGDQLSSEELELALSTQLFDDRVSIDGNLGMMGEHQQSQQNASNIIGDINVEVKITRDGRFRIRAFNKYNDMEITRRDAPYTQGVGAFYRREFDRFIDLFTPRKKLIIDKDSPAASNGNFLPQKPANNSSVN